MRDNEWLREQLESMWRTNFSDIEQVTPIHISFGRSAYRRLGSIVLRPAGVPSEKQHSQIIISGILRDSDIPDYVPQQVIAHELVHYVQGFGSHLPRTLGHPHQGGVILKEFHKRGLWELFRAYQSWMKVQWLPYLKQKGLV